MDGYEVRLECLRLSLEHCRDSTENRLYSVVEAARVFSDFISGENEATLIADAEKLAELVCKTGNTETLDAARDLAEKCRKAIPRLNEYGLVT